MPSKWSKELKVDKTWEFWMRQFFNLVVKTAI